VSSVIWQARPLARLAKPLQFCRRTSIHVSVWAGPSAQESWNLAPTGVRIKQYVRWRYCFRVFYIAANEECLTKRQVIFSCVNSAFYCLKFSFKLATISRSYEKNLRAPFFLFTVYNNTITMNNVPRNACNTGNRIVTFAGSRKYVNNHRLC